MGDAVQCGSSIACCLAVIGLYESKSIHDAHTVTNLLKWTASFDREHHTFAPSSMMVARPSSFPPVLQKLHGGLASSSRQHHLPLLRQDAFQLFILLLSHDSGTRSQWSRMGKKWFKWRNLRGHSCLNPGSSALDEQ